MKTVKLNRLRIASPCPASWDKMAGDDRQRHCERCDRTVYNLVDVTPEALVTLIEQTEGRLCARLYARRDGTVMTQDCPQAQPSVGRQVRTAATLAAGAAGLALAASTSAAVLMAPPDAIETSDLQPMLGEVAPEVVEPPEPLGPPTRPVSVIAP